MTKIKLIIFLLSVAVLQTACGALAGNKPIPVKELTFPKANYFSIVNINQNIVALTDGENVNNLWWYAFQGDQSIHLITFPEDPSCNDTVYVVPTLYSTGNLQLWKLCRTNTKTITYLVTYDWKIGQTNVVAGPFPLRSLELSWNPERTRGIVYLDNGFGSGTLYWIKDGSLGPLDMVIGDQIHSWNMKDDYPDFQGADKGITGDTGRADWSPDGDTIAFFASPDAIGKTEDARFYVDYKLYLVNPDLLTPKAVLDKIYFPFIIRWSADSKHIAFIGDYGSLNNTGIWLYTVGNNSAVNIAKGNFQDILWTADGNSLIAIYCKDLHDCSQIEQYDLTSLVKP